MSKRPTAWDQGPAPKKTQTVWSEPSMVKKETQSVTREISEHNTAGKTKAELQAALLKQKLSFKELKEIGKELEKFSPVGRENELDIQIMLADLSMKKYPHPQIFVCYRCDHVKTSSMKAKYLGNPICGSCFDHVTRCVIPFRELPEHQRPARCIHKVPKTYQKQFR